MKPKLVLAVFFILLMFSILSLAIPIDTAPSTAKEGSTITMLIFNVSNTSDTGNTLNNVTVDIFGNATAGNITNVTLEGPANTIYYNDAFTSFPINISIGATITQETNFTLRFVLISSATDGSTIGANITAIYNDTNITYSPPPYTSSLTTIDSAPPTIQYESPTPADNSNLSTSSIVINVSSTDTVSNISSCLLELNNVNYTMSILGSGSSVYCSYVNNTLPDGSYTYKVYSNDTYNHMGVSTTRSFVIDTTPPFIDWIFPTESNNSYFNRTWIVANVTIVESHFKNLTYKLYNSSGLVNQAIFTSYPNYINWTGLSEGTYWFNATAYDWSGNSNTTVLRYQTLDITPPIVNWNYPVNGMNITGNITLNLTIRDATSGWNVINITSYCGGSMGSQNVANINSTSDYITQWWDTTTASYNPYNPACNLQVWANDSAGNIMNPFNITVYIDNTPPSIYLGPNAQPFYSVNTFNLTYMPVENWIGLDTCILYGNFTGSWAPNATETNPLDSISNNFTVTLPDGTYTWNVWCNDTFGNAAFNSTNQTFVVDANAPRFDNLGFGGLDMFFSNCSNNNLIVINVTVTDGNGIKPSSVIANVTGLNNYTNCTLPTYPMNQISSNNYILTCEVNNTPENFTGVPIIIFANDTYDILNSTYSEIVIYGMTYPPGLGPGSTNFCNITDFESVTDLTFVPIDGRGMMVLNGPINLSDNNTVAKLQQLQYAVVFQQSQLGYTLGINMTIFNELNSSATLTAFNLSNAPSGIIRIDENGNIGLCPSSICTGSNWDGQNFTFNVTGFSYYSVDTTAPRVDIILPQNNTIFYTNIGSFSFNYTVSDNSLDKCWYNINDGSNITLPGCTNISIPYSSLSPGSNKITLYANDTGSNENHSIIYVTEMCGSTLTSDYTLTQNLYCSGTGIVINSNNIDLACSNGVSIIGNGTGNGIYINSSLSSSVSNCIIKGFYTGINLSSSNSSTISGNNILNNAFDGIYLLNSNNNNILSNVITNSTGDSGVWLDDSSDSNTISGNTITRAIYGIALYGSTANVSSNTIYNNTIYSISLGAKGAIHLYNAFNNTVDSNVIYSSAKGIYLDSSSLSNTIRSNTIRNNSYGLYVESSSGINTIILNEIYDNANVNYIAKPQNIANNTFHVYLTSPDNNYLVEDTKTLGFTFYTSNLINGTTTNCTIYIGGVDKGVKQGIVDMAENAFNLTTSGGVYWYVRCKDPNNNTGESERRFLRAPEVGSSGSLPALPPKNEMTAKIFEVKAGEEFEVPLDKEEIPLLKINVKVRNSVKNVELKIVASENAPQGIEVPGRDVYRFITIDKTNIEDSDISDVGIKFKVSKEWLENNNIDIDSVVLSRYENGVWNDLDTSSVGSDDKYYYFEAISPGLSVYAITTKTTVEEEGIAEKEKETVPVNETTGPSGKEIEKSNDWIYVVVIVILIIVAFIFFKKK